MLMLNEISPSLNIKPISLNFIISAYVMPTVSKYSSSFGKKQFVPLDTNECEHILMKSSASFLLKFLTTSIVFSEKVDGCAISPARILAH